MRWDAGFDALLSFVLVMSFALVARDKGFDPDWLQTAAIVAFMACLTGLQHPKRSGF